MAMIMSHMLSAKAGAVGRRVAPAHFVLPLNRGAWACWVCFIKTRNGGSQSL